MNPLLVSLISLIISSISTIVVSVTAFLIWRQIKTTHDWNRRKTTQETLDKLVIGECPELRHKLEQGCKCTIWDKAQTYETVTKPLSKEQKEEIDYYLARILNIFETIAINIKNNVIDEDICYDYFGLIFTEYHRWTKPFIDEKRKIAGNPRVLLDFGNYAKKWSERMDLERNEFEKGISIPGKGKL